MKTKHDVNAKFIQITNGTGGLYALDENGHVWKYHPHTPNSQRFAFWGKVTAHRADPEKETQ